MGILDSILGRRESLAVSVGGMPLTDPSLLAWLGLRPTSAAGVAVGPEEALSLSAVFAAVHILSETIGALPLQVYRRQGEQKTIAATHPAYRLLHTSPNPEMTAKRFRQVREFHRLLWGASYAEIGYDAGGNARSLWPVEPWRVHPDRDQDTGELYYQVDGLRRVHPEDMLVNLLVSKDGVTGKSFVDYALTSLGLGIAAQEFAARFFGNGARPGGILEHPGSPGESSRKELRESWTKQHGGPDNAHKVGVLWGGWKFNREAGTIAPEEAQLLETRRFTGEEVARWLNLPPHLIRDLSRATFSNIEQQQIEFVVYTLAPILVDYEQEYDRKLLNPPALYSKHSVTGLMRGDSAARSAWYREMFGIGVYSVNDICDSEDLNPIGPEGDVRFVPVNMQPLEKAIAPPPAPPAPPAPPGPPAPGSAPAPPPPMPDPTAGLARRVDLLADTLARMLGVEAMACRRAARRPDRFLTWMDEFYPKHAPKLAAALEVVLPLCGCQIESGVLASNWVEHSRTALLAITDEATPARLSEMVEKEIVRWEANRATEQAMYVINPN